MGRNPVIVRRFLLSFAKLFHPIDFAGFSGRLKSMEKVHGASMKQSAHNALPDHEREKQPYSHHHRSKKSQPYG